MCKYNTNNVFFFIYTINKNDTSITVFTYMYIFLHILTFLITIFYNAFSYLLSFIKYVIMRKKISGVILIKKYKYENKH